MKMASKTWKGKWNGKDGNGTSNENGKGEQPLARIDNCLSL